jgi:malate/lactate dehydrogenase
MAESILKDKKKILPCAAYLSGEYGIKDLFVGVPVKLGERGVEEIVQIKLNEEERKALNHSADPFENWSKHEARVLQPQTGWHRKAPLKGALECSGR